MAGGLLSLVSEGAHCAFLMGNPEKTFFRTTYAKHTNFGLQKFRIDYDGLRDLRLTEPSTFRFKIPRYADLLMDAYLVVTLPDIFSPIYHPCAETNYKWAPYEFQWIKNIGTSILSQVEIICGNTTLAKYSGDYIRSVVERDFPAEKKSLFYRMTGNVSDLYQPSRTTNRTNTYPSAYYTSSTTGAEPSIRGRNLYIPLHAWFSLSSKMALPLVCLQYAELYVQVTLRPIKELFQIRDVFDYTNNFPFIAPDFTLQQFQMYRFLQTPPYERIDASYYDNQVNTWNADIHLTATYAFLSDDEARMFAAHPQMYLVRDVREHSFQNVVGSKKLSIPSSGMVSSWMIYLQRSDVYLRNEWSNMTNWPYSMQPYDLQFPASTSETVQSTVYTDPLTQQPYLTGPMYDCDGKATNIYITGNYSTANQKEILMTLAILLNGSYRENTMESGIYNYLEKYAHSAGDAPDGLYCYNFCLSTNPFTIQPCGAINMSAFRTIELEVTTFIPEPDPAASVFNVVCDDSGHFVGVAKQNWRLYEYTYTMTLLEEGYNVVAFQNGNVGLLYAK